MDDIHSFNCWVTPTVCRAPGEVLELSWSRCSQSFVKVMGVSVYAALGHIEQSAQADPLLLGPGDTERSRGGLCSQSSGGERQWNQAIPEEKCPNSAVGAYEEIPENSSGWLRLREGHAGPLKMSEGAQQPCRERACRLPWARSAAPVVELWGHEGLNRLGSVWGAGQQP